MYVQTFQADSMEEALVAIKKGLGPSAVILKTVTNKGLKGAFKKSKIEITAAITEEEYKKKLLMEKNLNEAEKKSLYSNKASIISETINQYNNLGKILHKKDNNVNNKEDGPSFDDFIGEQQQEKKITQEKDLENFSPKFDSITDKEREKDLENKKNEILILKNDFFQLKEKIEYLESIFEKDKKENDEFYFFASNGINLSILKSIREDLWHQKKRPSKENYLEILSKFIQCKIPAWVKNQEEKSLIVFFDISNSLDQFFPLQMASLMSNISLLRMNHSVTEMTKTLDKSCIPEVISHIHYLKNEEEIIKYIKKERNNFQKTMLYLTNDDIKNNEHFFDILKNTFDHCYINIIASLSQDLDQINFFSKKYRMQTEMIHFKGLDKYKNFTKMINFSLENIDIPIGLFSIGDEIPSGLEYASLERIMSQLL